MMKSIGAIVFALSIASPLAAQWVSGTGAAAGTARTASRAGIDPSFSDTVFPRLQLEVGYWSTRPSDIVSGITSMGGASVAGDLFAGNDGGGRARLSANAVEGFLQWNSYYNGNGLRVMDATRPGYSLNFRAFKIGGVDSTIPEQDGITFQRYTAVGQTISTPVSLLSIDKDGNVTASGTIAANYQDVAEWVPGTGELPPGTVVVLDGERSNQVIASTKAYDHSVAGVVSDRPGLLLGTRGASTSRVSTLGRVKVNVDASRHPVKIGDLLVTSDKPGMAMVSEAVEINGIAFHRPGTLIGKALEPLATGEGQILVLLSLQ
jgi:hypothetical protein